MPDKWGGSAAKNEGPHRGTAPCPSQYSLGNRIVLLTNHRLISGSGKSVDGRPLTEVAAILFYLAKCNPSADLLPVGDIEAEAQAVSWMSFCAATLHPAIGIAYPGPDWSERVPHL